MRALAACAVTVLACALAPLLGCGTRTWLDEADARAGDAAIPDGRADAPEGGDAEPDGAEPDGPETGDAASDAADDAADAEPDARITEVGCASDADCDDRVGCTRDACAAGVCTHTPLDARCDDGLFCTGDERCDAVKGCFTLPRACADAVSCTVDRCDEASKSCTHTTDDKLCPISHVCDPALDCQARAIAHTSSALYEIRVPSGVVKLIGKTTGTLTDIALHPSGTLYGVRFDGLCEIDLKTGACVTALVSLPSNPVGLDAAPDGALYGAAGTQVYSIDRTTGATKLVATFPAGLVASGDIAFVGARMLVTARGGGVADDTLVELDPTKGTGKVLGRTGYRCIWGVAAYGPTLYGLTCEGRVLRMDPNTGASVELSKAAVEFWGATAR